MCLRQYNSLLFQCGGRHETSESEVYRRQILAFKLGPRAESVNLSGWDVFKFLNLHADVALINSFFAVKGCGRQAKVHPSWDGQIMRALQTASAAIQRGDIIDRGWHAAWLTQFFGRGLVEIKMSTNHRPKNRVCENGEKLPCCRLLFVKTGEINITGKLGKETKPVVIAAQCEGK